MFYLPNSPFWMRMIFPAGVVWKASPANNTVYLSFDDGPDPEVTAFVLDELDKVAAKATFFCIGDNVQKHPEMFARLQAAGHRVGNHTMHHKNGWKTKDLQYVTEIQEANKAIQSDLFRPPYGKITSGQAELLKRPIAVNQHGEAAPFRIIMWSVITGDFDDRITAEKCFRHATRYTRPGSIIVFHDSQKAFPRLKIALPKTLQWLKENNYSTGLL